MAIFDSLRNLLGRGTQYEQQVTYVGPTVSEVLGLGPEDLFRTQPHLRTVITFVARNIAQLPLHAYERASDTDRRRVTDDPMAMLLKAPNPDMTWFELMYATISDLKLYDQAVWMTVEDPGARAGWIVRPIPPSWVDQTGGGTAWSPSWISVVHPVSGRRTKLEGDQFLSFHGYRPGSPSKGVSPVESLKEILAEQIQAWSYRQQVWQRGGRVGAYITRPKDSAWSPEARERFAHDWSAKWTGKDGPKAGGTPILEDGMTLNRLAFSAREDEWSEVAKLSLATVAAVYHTSPTMVGILDNANYSNVREFHQMLYTDTLGPDLAMIEARINTFLVPLVSKVDGLYVEFNVAAKLAGSFEEQAAVMSTSTGRPWMTANEARAKVNLPALDGDAEYLVTPLNVLIGGQSSPQDGGPPAGSAPKGSRGSVHSKDAAGEPIRIKAQAATEHEKAAQQVLARFFKRQRAVVLSALGAKADGAEWWDEARWNAELASDLLALAVSVTTEIGAETLKGLGVDPGDYSEGQALEFLKAVADSRAGAINSTTRDQVAAALDDDLEESAAKATPAGVFDEAESTRAEKAGRTIATTLAAFAVTEAVKQLGRPAATKTWRTTSSSPRSAHARMDGETVGIDEKFSNRAEWPGDPVLGADGVAGCMCTVDVDIP